MHKRIPSEVHSTKKRRKQTRWLQSVVRMTVQYCGVSLMCTLKKVEEVIHRRRPHIRHFRRQSGMRPLSWDFLKDVYEIFFFLFTFAN